MSAGNKVKTVAIKTLVEFAAKTGSLDRRFTPSPTGKEGIEGHQHLTAKRGKHYEAEVSLRITYRDILFRGRADGYDANAHCIEEIKTFYGDVSQIPYNHQELHWAQVKCYGWIYCQTHQCDQINLSLIYFNLTDDQEFPLKETWDADALQDFFELLAEKYYQWQIQINKRLTHLHYWIEELPFPYHSMHKSQRIMAEAAYKAAATGRVLLAEAPTGTGKTLAALFPALKAITRTLVDKVFYLTAKTTGKQLALENIQLIITDKNGKDSAPLRALELTAREKACLEPDKKCMGDSCPYAFDFYTKLQSARQAAYAIPLLDKQALNALALAFEICPFYLSMEMSRWVDIIVADVNYFFDGTPLLLALTNQFDWKPYLLVDESHNLIDRGRSMYSAALHRGDLLSAKRSTPIPIKKALEKINKAWLALLKTMPEKSDSLFLLPTPPEKLGVALLDFTTVYLDFLQKHPEHPVQETLAQEIFFSALHYLNIVDILDGDFCIDMQNLGSKNELLTLRNLIPAKPLGARLKFAHCACYFSATLNPAYYYQSLLGLPQDTVHIKVPSPFRSEQLDIKIATGLSTRYRDRATAIPPICKIIKQQLLATPGNAIVFFSSYDFLQKTEIQLRPELNNLPIEIMAQSKRMSEEDRQEFIDKFNQQNNLLGLAVLGGAFSEGIDLSGDALQGVFIATLGLPQVNPVNEHLRDIMQQQFNQGYDFAYTYPGIQKIIQAAGRVIRTPTDLGYLWLLDERYHRGEIKNLLPDWWKIH